MSRQRLGQHFLAKGSILERIARAACPDREPLVIEIGPGRGALTEKLLEKADRVIAIEIDAELVDVLREKFRDEPRLTLIHADVLETDLGQWGASSSCRQLAVLRRDAHHREDTFGRRLTPSCRLSCPEGSRRPARRASAHARLWLPQRAHPALG